MPELPEVEIVKQSLQKAVKLKRINRVLVKNRNLRFKIDDNFEKSLKKKKIINIRRFAKYLIIELENKSFILIHLGMSGTMHILKKNKKKINTNLSFYFSKNLPKKHNHINFYFDNFKLVFNDPRRFGFMILFNEKKKLHKYLDNYAPDPFNKSFNIDYLKSNLLKRKKNIKNILLDQKIISGIGNIYASEILFYAKINPNKKGHQLSIISLKNLLKFCKFVLKKSISRGGSSIQNFKNINSNPGFYQNDFKVYDREDKKCFSLNCNLKIKKIIISNRSTFYCKNCQK